MTFVPELTGEHPLSSLSRYELEIQQKRDLRKRIENESIYHAPKGTRVSGMKRYVRTPGHSNYFW